MLKRLFRIWPAYIFWTFAFIYLRMDKPFDGTAAEVVRSLLFIPLRLENPPFYGYASLIVGWTLNYEILFYACFAFSLLFGRGFRWLVVTVLLMGLVSLPVLFGADFTTYSDRPQVFDRTVIDFATNPIILNFLVGMTMAAVYLSRIKLPVELLYCVALLATSAITWQMSFQILNVHGIFGLGLFLPPLFLSLVLLERDGRLNVPPALVWLGGISYSLYLCHVVVFNVVSNTFYQARLSSLTPGWSFLGLMVAISLVLAAMSRFLLEGVASNQLYRLLGIKATSPLLSRMPPNRQRRFQ